MSKITGRNQRVAHEDTKLTKSEVYPPLVSFVPSCENITKNQRKMV